MFDAWLQPFLCFHALALSMTASFKAYFWGMSVVISLLPCSSPVILASCSGNVHSHSFIFIAFPSQWLHPFTLRFKEICSTSSSFIAFSCSYLRLRPFLFFHSPSTCEHYQDTAGMHGALLFSTTTGEARAHRSEEAPNKSDPLADLWGCLASLVLSNVSSHASLIFGGSLRLTSSSCFKAVSSPQAMFNRFL